MRLIKGENLTSTQVQQVKSAYIYRWTIDNNRLESVYSNITGKPTMPLISDEQWLKEHAFWFINDGSRLAHTHKHAEPSYMAD